MNPGIYIIEINMILSIIDIMILIDLFQSGMIQFQYRIIQNTDAIARRQDTSTSESLCQNGFRHTIWQDE